MHRGENHPSSPGSTAASSDAPAVPGSLTEEESMELEEHVREPDIEEMEVDTMDWRMRDRVDLARKRAVRIKRAALQKKNLLLGLEAKEKRREELQESFRQDILEDWEKEQLRFMTGVLVKETCLVFEARWNPDLESEELSESDVSVGEKKHISWSLKLQVSSTK